MNEAVKLRYEVVYKAIEARGGGFAEGVVIMRDIDVSWHIQVSEYDEPGQPVDDLDVNERKRREDEWGKDAERGYELAERLGVEAKVACPRTGKGVNEAFEDLVLQVMEGRKVAEGGAKNLLVETRRVEEKRTRSYSSRLKTFIRRKVAEEEAKKLDEKARRAKEERSLSYSLRLKKSLGY